MVVVAVGHHIAVITAEQKAQNLFYKLIINQNQIKIYYVIRKISMSCKHGTKKI